MWRRTAIGVIFLFAATVIFCSAEPFADGLVHMGEKLGIEQFVLVQWLAPLASESPEFLLAGLLAARGRPGAGMTILLSSKVSQWTLLIGSVPAAYAISGTTLSPLHFDTRQAEEVFLTAGQSLFAVAIFVSLSMSVWEAALLAVLFASQLFFSTTVRIGYGSVYLLIALGVLFRDRPVMPVLWRTAKESVRTSGSGSRRVQTSTLTFPPLKSNMPSDQLASASPGVVRWTRRSDTLSALRGGGDQSTWRADSGGCYALGALWSWSKSRKDC